MKPWVLLDSVLTPDGKVISLHAHDGSRSIRVDGRELMSTRRHTSEEKMADLCCGRLKEKPHASVLIGGLGFGFTMRAAVGWLREDASVIVAELLEPVIRWNAGPHDPRITIVQRDVVELIRESPSAYDGIILDIDNGPHALTQDSNARLYDVAGLLATRKALKPHACAAWWSAKPDIAFEKSLAQAGFVTTSHRSAGHTIFVATRSDYKYK